jgi:hypothetical protein
VPRLYLPCAHSSSTTTPFADLDARHIASVYIVFLLWHIINLIVQAGASDMVSAIVYSDFPILLLPTSERTEQSNH